MVSGGGPMVDDQTMLSGGLQTANEWLSSDDSRRYCFAHGGCWCFCRWARIARVLCFLSRCSGDCPTFLGDIRQRKMQQA